MIQVERWENIEHAARDAYEAYGQQVAWQNHQGQRMPMWDDLPVRIQKAWVASVRCTLAKAYRIVAADLITHVETDCESNCKMLAENGD